MDEGHTDEPYVQTPAKYICGDCGASNEVRRDVFAYKMCVQIL